MKVQGHPFLCTQGLAYIPMQNEEHSGSGSKRHLIKVEEIVNYQRGLVDNVSGKDTDHRGQEEAGFTVNVWVLGSGKTKNGWAVTREARE